MLESMTAMKTEKESAHRLKMEARKKLPFLIACGNEEDIVAYAKAWNPEITPEQLKRVVRLYRAAKLARAHSPQPD